MTATVKNFRDLVEHAHSGRLKLPAFQRNWRWKTEKVKKLFDSLRQGYPIGSLLFLGGEGADLSPRVFSGSAAAATGVATENLVLDGQQRLTAGIHLFHGTGNRQYYLDIARLAELVAEQKIDLKNAEEVKGFAATLDTDDGYLIARTPVDDPRSLLIDKHLLCTVILSNQAQLNQALLDYSKKYPEREPLMFSLVSPYFSMSNLEPVPFVTIDAGTQLDAISRIFTTLNTTGQLLTPFELVVAILFPKGIDLVKEFQELCNIGKYFRNMDRTGEVLLQTIAMMANADPKKSLLPKTIKPAIFLQHYEAAFDALENLGEFLTNDMGAALDVKDASLVPYDAIFAPMACAYSLFKKQGLKGVEERNGKRKFERWYVASALSQRYQEGVHNKQRRDYSEVMAWVFDDAATPSWIQDVTVPNLNRASFDGAVGKLVQSLFNLNNIRDPLTGSLVGFRLNTAPTEKHHLFPSKYVTGFANWNKKQGDTADVVCNMMFVERDTNRKWLNKNPCDQINEALNGMSEAQLSEKYASQFISPLAFELLKKPQKSKDDFYAFTAERQRLLREYIRDKYGFPIANADLQEDLDEEDEHPTEPEA